jgi:MerR family transcriptional regulator/heat shock protein HspR
MSQPIIPRDQVAEHFAVPVGVLVRYEARGLVRPVRLGAVEGYGPAEIRRLWTILSFQRDLGINLAGVEAILKLRDHLAEVHRRLDHLARELREFVESEHAADHDG